MQHFVPIIFNQRSVGTYNQNMSSKCTMFPALLIKYIFQSPIFFFQVLFQQLMQKALVNIRDKKSQYYFFQHKKSVRSTVTAEALKSQIILKRRRRKFNEEMFSLEFSSLLKPVHLLNCSKSGVAICQEVVPCLQKLVQQHKSQTQAKAVFFVGFTHVAWSYRCLQLYLITVIISNVSIWAILSFMRMLFIAYQLES